MPKLIISEEIKMTKNRYDETVVQALVLQELGKCPDLGLGELRAKVTWCALGDCQERREATRRLKNMGQTPSWEKPAASEGPE